MKSCVVKLDDTPKRYVMSLKVNPTDTEKTTSILSYAFCRSCPLCHAYECTAGLQNKKKENTDTKRKKR